MYSHDFYKGVPPDAFLSVFILRATCDFFSQGNVLKTAKMLLANQNKVIIYVH